MSPTIGRDERVEIELDSSARTHPDRMEQLIAVTRRRFVVSTTKQKQAARKNIAKARKTQSARAHGRSVPRKSRGLSTAQQNDLPDSAFAFTEQRKEPLTDAKHVRNAVARFDQVEGVSNADRDKAWRKIRRAARKFDVEISERGWRQLMEGGKARKN